jgi:Mg2+ and Co2+ transporter CorA
MYFGSSTALFGTYLFVQVLKGHKAALVAAVEEHDELLEIIHKLIPEDNELKKLLSDDESQFRDATLKKTSSNRQLHELQDSLAEKNTALAQVEQMTNGLLDRAIALQHSLREGLQRKLQHFAASVSRLEAEKLVTL